MLKLMRTKIIAVIITIAMLWGQFAGIAGLSAASASSMEVKIFLINCLSSLDNLQIETMFDLSIKIIGTEGALTTAQLNKIQENNLTKARIMTALAEIKQKVMNVLQERETQGYVSIEDLEQLMTDIKASIEGVLLNTALDVLGQIYKSFKVVPASEMEDLFGTDITAAMKIVNKRGLDKSTTQKILEALTTDEKTSLKEIIIATGLYADEDASSGSSSSGGGSSATVTTTTSTAQLSKEDVAKQIADNASKIVVNLTDVIEIMPEVMAEIVNAGKDIEVKNEAEKAVITIPVGAIEMPAGSSLKISLKPVSTENSSSFMVGLPSGAKIASKILDISAVNVNNSVESKVELKKSISITLHYDTDAVNQSVEDNLVGYWFNPSNNSWVSMGGTVDKTAKTVTFTTDHLSIYALMVKHVTFADTSGHWAQSDIEAMAALNVVKGGSDGLFYPNSNITRAEFSAMLVRLLGIESQQQGELKFTDVSSDKWYNSVVSAAYSNGLIQGYDESSFGPEDNITREQLATMVTRAYVYRGGTQPDNALAESKLTVFTDSTGISTWAVKSTAMAVDKKIISGYPDGKFKPSASATRAEALVMLQRLLNVLK